MHMMNTFGAPDVVRRLASRSSGPEASTQADIYTSYFLDV